MGKVVYNACYGGFGLSEKACLLIAERKGFTLEPGTTWRYHDGLYNIDRHDKDLVEVVEALGKKASGPYSKLEIYETDCAFYRIDEYDGYEEVFTHDTQTWSSF